MIREVLEPGGLLASRHPGYEPRPSQVRMGVAVGRALEEAEHLLVEAPPGTGKTFAYLVPAIDSGRTVVISTGTRTLQDQLFQRDIPLLSKVIGRPIRAALMKGRENYLCVHRLDGFTSQGALTGFGGDAALEASRLAGVRAWARATDTGDRAELAELPEPWRPWEKIDARADTCLGQKCEQYDACFLTRMRRRAQEADLIVVNHHLLLSDLVLKASAYGAIIPEYRFLIVDEAHMLEEVATAHLGRSLSSYQIADLAVDAAAFAERRASDSAEGSALAMGGRELKAAAADMHALFGEELRGRFLLAPLLADGDTRRRLDETRLALDGIARAAESLENPSEESDALRRRGSDLARTLEFLLKTDDDSAVFWGERRGRGIFLTASPIDVSSQLRELLFQRIDAAVLTSATLTVDGSFEFVRERVGLGRAATLSLPSPFDLETQSILYVPAATPEPSEAAFAQAVDDQIRSLLAITEGRAFLLFTSLAAMRRERESLEGTVDWPLLMQGEASRHALLDRFRATPNAVLLATASFWQGVDVPGESLSLVVIEKLPFDVPSDPIVAARCEAVRRRGGNAFEEYQLPAAVIDLKQGLGRLLRARTDRGVLAVLDGRLRTKRYGSTFLKSLPPYPVVDSLASVREFFLGERAA
ncbi:MAG: ATP-dependent DNA helicase [Acidobacteria bacterium]|nr:ATP-dependent DNA helicase [Acidobacteriota bacterium]